MSLMEGEVVLLDSDEEENEDFAQQQNNGVEDVIELESDDDDGDEDEQENETKTGKIGSFEKIDGEENDEVKIVWDRNKSENDQNQQLMEMFLTREQSPECAPEEIGMGKPLLVNPKKPSKVDPKDPKKPDDPEVFVAPHLSDFIQLHQLEGIRFMYKNIIGTLEEYADKPGNGCILAHSMGLGKTIQAIAFVEIFLRVTRFKRVLILCPVNVIQNWVAEFDQWLPSTSSDNSIGTSSSSSPSPFRPFNLLLVSENVRGFNARAAVVDEWHREGGVLLIGYEMFRLLVQIHQKQNGVNSANANSASKRLSKKSRSAASISDTAADDKINGVDNNKDKQEEELKSFEDLKTTLREHLFSGPDLVICDEGHRIKNRKSDIAHSLSQIKTRRRVVLTGSPLQNNLTEYFCMVDFVWPGFLGTWKDFFVKYEKPIREGMHADATPAHAKEAKKRLFVLTQTLAGFVQRRSQAMLKKILPELHEFVVVLRKAPIQHALYKAFVEHIAFSSAQQSASYNPLRAFATCLKIVNHPDILYHAWLRKRRRFEALPSETADATGPGNGGGLSNNPNSATSRSQEKGQQFIFDQQHKLPTDASNGPFNSRHFQQQQQKGNNWLLDRRTSGSNGAYCHQFDGHQRNSNFPKNYSVPSFFQQGTTGEPSAELISAFDRVPLPPDCYGPTPSNNNRFQSNNMFSTPYTASAEQFFPHQIHHQLGPLIRGEEPRNNTSDWNPNCSTYQRENHLMSSYAPPEEVNNGFSRPPPHYSNNKGDNNNHCLRLPTAFASQTSHSTTAASEPSIQGGRSGLEKAAKNGKNKNSLGGGIRKRPMKKRPKQTVDNTDENSVDFQLLKDEDDLDTIDLDEYFDWADPLFNGGANNGASGSSSAPSVQQRYQTGQLEHSSKFVAAMALIRATVARGEKILVFSQSIDTLNLLELFLERDRVPPPNRSHSKNGGGEPIHRWSRDLNYCRFDGTTPSAERDLLIRRFNEDPALRLFLISTRAGSLGVNLVSASRVIIFDACFNPTHDSQAICRVYRYGQKRRTFVYRLVMDNSMERKIFNRQILKHSLQKRVIDKQSTDATITNAEVKDLLQYDENLDVCCGSIDPRKFKFDDEVLGGLLRSRQALFSTIPFLHDTLMRDGGPELSDEEKKEALFWYNRDKALAEYELFLRRGGGGGLINNTGAGYLPTVLRNPLYRGGYPHHHPYTHPPLQNHLLRPHHPILHSTPLPKQLLPVDKSREIVGGTSASSENGTTAINSSLHNPAKGVPQLPQQSSSSSNPIPIPNKGSNIRTQQMFQHFPQRRIGGDQRGGRGRDGSTVVSGAPPSPVTLPPPSPTIERVVTVPNPRDFGKPFFELPVIQDANGRTGLENQTKRLNGGERVLPYRTSRGVYLRTVVGETLDATKCRELVQHIYPNSLAQPQQKGGSTVIDVIDLE